MNLHSESIDSAAPERDSRRRSPVYLVALGAFALGMASYVTAGLIPLIETSFSVSAAVAAQLVTAFTLAYGLGSPLCVALLPAGRRRLGLLLALGAFALANAASALTGDFFRLLLFRAVAGVASGVYLALGIAAATALAPSGGRGKAIAVIMGGMASGTVLGVPVSLWLAERLGWSAAFWLIAALGLAALCGLMRRRPALPAAARVSQGNRLALLADRRVLGILLVSLLAAVASLGMYTFLAPLLADPGFGGVGSVVPWLWAWGIGGVLGSFLVGPLADRVQGPALTFAIMLTLTFALLLLPLAAAWNAWLALGPIMVWGAVGWALQVPQNDELLKAREGRQDGHLAVALNESALYLGGALGPREAGCCCCCIGRSGRWRPARRGLPHAARCCRRRICADDARAPDVRTYCGGRSGGACRCRKSAIAAMTPSARGRAGSV